MKKCLYCDKELTGKQQRYCSGNHSSKDRRRRKRTEAKSGPTHVYYLPEEHYVGITRNLIERMEQHRIMSGRITTGWELIATFERAVDAHWLETLFHQRGYNGFRP